jgi:hypothetical protein
MAMESDCPLLTPLRAKLLATSLARFAAAGSTAFTGTDGPDEELQFAAWLAGAPGADLSVATVASGAGL